MGGGGGGTHTQTTTQELSPEQRELLKPVIPVAKEFIANPPTQYQGSGISPFTPLQQQAQQMTLNAAQGIGQGVQGAIGGTQQAIGGLGGTVGAAQNQSAGVFPTLNPTFGYAAGGAQGTNQALQGAIGQGQAQTAPGLNFLTSGAVLSPNSNPYLQQAVQAASRPAISQFENVILPNIASDAISAGGYGGTRQQIAQGLAAQGLQNQLGDISANIFSNAYGQGLGAMGQGLNTSVAQSGQQLNALVQGGQLTQQAANAIMQGQLGGFGAQNQANQTAQAGLGAQISGQQGLPNLLNASLTPAQLTSSVGEQQQAMQQALLTEQVQKYINEQLIPFAAAQDVAALAFGIPAGQSKTVSSGGSSGMGGMQALQMGMSALPLMLGKSDIRLKENVKQIGILSEGLGVYSFNFKRAPGRPQVGLIAQEVQKIYPSAVVEKNGYLHVKYNEIPGWTEMAECFLS